MKRKLAEVSSKYGAPMGRRNNIPNDIETVGKLYLEKLRRIDGDYDYGGAYWGCGGRGQNIYWAYGETATEQVDIFVRAIGRKNAKEEVETAILTALNKRIKIKYYR